MSACSSSSTSMSSRGSRWGPHHPCCPTRKTGHLICVYPVVCIPVPIGERAFCLGMTCHMTRNIGKNTGFVLVHSGRSILVRSRITASVMRATCIAMQTSYSTSANTSMLIQFGATLLESAHKGIQTMAPAMPTGGNALNVLIGIVLDCLLQTACWYRRSMLLRASTGAMWSS